MAASEAVRRMRRNGGGFDGSGDGGGEAQSAGLHLAIRSFC